MPDNQSGGEGGTVPDFSETLYLSASEGRTTCLVYRAGVSVGNCKFPKIRLNANGYLGFLRLSVSLTPMWRSLAIVGNCAAYTGNAFLVAVESKNVRLTYAYYRSISRTN